MSRPFGLMLVAVGLGIVIIGLLVWSGALSWFGRLPGDIRIERDNLRVRSGVGGPMNQPT